LGDDAIALSIAMRRSRKTYSKKIILKARQDYLNGLTVNHITKTADVNTGTLYKWLEGDVRGLELDPIPRRRVGVQRLRPLKTMRIALVTRLWHTAEQQVREIEQRLANAGQPPLDRDRDARLLAVLVKTLRELAAMDRDDEANAKKREAAKPSSEERPFRDIEDFRRQLAARIAALAAEAEAEADRGDGSDMAEHH
jgi:AcrR family transcriptional regulator